MCTTKTTNPKQALASVSGLSTCFQLVQRPTVTGSERHGSLASRGIIAYLLLSAMLVLGIERHWLIFQNCKWPCAVEVQEGRYSDRGPELHAFIPL